MQLSRSSKSSGSGAAGAQSRSYSFEASGDGAYALERAQEIRGSEPDADIQVGFYETEGELMEGAAENIAALKKLGVRVNLGRDITGEVEESSSSASGDGSEGISIPDPGDPRRSRRMSATEYDLINFRNLMAAGSGGRSDTSLVANTPLTAGAIAMQSAKLKEGGKLEVAASSSPFFKPSTNPHRQGEPYAFGKPGVDHIDVDRIARDSGLARSAREDYQDDSVVKKNRGERRVGVDGTHTKVFRKPPPRRAPVGRGPGATSRPGPGGPPLRPSPAAKQRQPSPKSSGSRSRGPSPAAARSGNPAPMPVPIIPVQRDRTNPWGAAPAAASTKPTSLVDIMKQAEKERREKERREKEGK